MKPKHKSHDIATIYRRERARWLKEEAPRRSFRHLVAASVPYWIVIVALVLFGLSAPHTAKIFTMLTPRWGIIAPIGVEFGLLYAAFRRRLAHSADEKLPWTLWAMEILLFITAILVNGAGAFVSVVSVTNLDSLSFTAIMEQFTILPATSQAALIMAALSSLIIPIGTLVAGDGLADLTLDQREGRNFKEQQWQQVQRDVLYRALYVTYKVDGLRDKQARKRAYDAVEGYLGSPASPVRSLSAESAQQILSAPNAQITHAQPESVKSRIRAHLAEHPELLELSVNGVLSALNEHGVQAGRTSVAEVLREHRLTTQ
ncbi:MAG: hypothetical protein AAF846_05640 [Chloroflexota bacterium]